MTDRVIYDFGMNNGDDTEYYLLKADRVVGVEANEALCEAARQRFSAEIAAGRLTVLNVALAASDDDPVVTFHLHKSNSLLSQLPPPQPSEADDFVAVQVESRTPASIIREYGDPLYVKIDVEHFDLFALRNIFEARIYPLEISAESHTIDVFACLVENGYDSFNLVDGLSVPKIYGEAEVQTAAGSRTFRFKPHSAGPFGEDIKSPWEDSETFFYSLASGGLGWKDIHASKQISPAPRPARSRMLLRQLSGGARQIFGGLKRRVPRLTSR